MRTPISSSCARPPPRSGRTFASSDRAYATWTRRTPPRTTVTRTNRPARHTHRGADRRRRGPQRQHRGARHKINELTSDDHDLRQAATEAESEIANLRANIRVVQKRSAEELADSRTETIRLERDLQERLDGARTSSSGTRRVPLVVRDPRRRPGGAGCGPSVRELSARSRAARTGGERSPHRASVAAGQAVSADGCDRRCSTCSAQRVLRPDAVEAVLRRGVGLRPATRGRASHASNRRGRGRRGRGRRRAPDVADRTIGTGRGSRPSPARAASCSAASSGRWSPGLTRSSSNSRSPTAAESSSSTTTSLSPRESARSRSSCPDVEVAVVMATYNPKTALFERQIASIQAQEHSSWCCIVCDDASSAEHLDAMRADPCGRRALRPRRERAAGRLLPELRARAPVGASSCTLRGPLGPGRRLVCRASCGVRSLCSEADADDATRRERRACRGCIGKRRSRRPSMPRRTAHVRGSLQPLRRQLPDRRFDGLSP